MSGNQVRLELLRPNEISVIGPDPRTFDPSVAEDILVAIADWLACVEVDRPEARGP